MIHDCLSNSPSRLVLRAVFSALMVFSGLAGGTSGRSAVLDSTLVNYTRASLNLSLCAVAFEEEFGDTNRASHYQNGSIRAETLIQEGGWTEEQALGAHDVVLQEDFSFTLSPGTTWSSFRRERFTRKHCDGMLAAVCKAGGESHLC